MLRSFLFTLFLSLWVSQAFCENQCADVFNWRGAPANHVDFLKNYLAVNLAFPQYRETINLSLAAFYFSRDISFNEIHRQFTDHEWDMLYTTMMRAHARYRVTREVAVDEIKAVYAVFVGPLVFTVPNVMNHMIAPLSLSSVGQDFYRRIDHFWVSEQYSFQRNHLRLYSETILHALRTEEARELSHRFRQGLHLSVALQEISRLEMAQLMRELVVRNLIANHPELANKTEGESLAMRLYNQMAGIH